MRAHLAIMIAGLLVGASDVLAQADLPLDDRSAYEQAREIGTVAAYDAFLRHFPSGHHADLAKAARRLLATPDVSDSDAAGVLRWSHNGSVMVLAAKGYSWQLFYEAPRAGIRKAGAEQGTLLLDGRARGGEVSGTAYVFAGGCGAFPYKVAGRMVGDGRRVVVSGQAPRVDPKSCRVSGNIDDELVFERLDEGAGRTAGVNR